jgi:glycosyltransferase involved in cell wall biosynthesis
VRRVVVVVYELYARDARVRRHARAMVAAGYTVEVGSLAGDQSLEAARADGVAIAPLGGNKYRGASRWAYLLAYVAFTLRAFALISRRVIQRRADLVYINNPPDFLVFAAIAARIRGVPVILDIHDMTSDLYVAKFGPPARAGSLVSWVIRAIERISLRFADALVTIHDLYAHRLTAIVRPGTPVVSVWNVPDAEAWLPVGDRRAKESHRVERPTPEHPLRLGHHGTIVERFGVDRAVSAVALLRQEGLPVTLSILGDGDFADALSAGISESGAADAIRFDRRIFSHDDLEAFTAEIDVGIAPYRPSSFSEEGLPTKVLEYLALGVPVISTETALLRHHLASVVRLVSGNDVDELTAAIAEMADPEVRAAYRRAGRPAAHDMGWPGQRGKLIELIDRQASPRR